MNMDITLVEIKSFAITCTADNARCAELQREVKSRLAEIDEAFDATIAARHAEHKAAVEQKKRIAEPWKLAKDFLGQKALAWRTAEEQRIEQERRRLQAIAEAEALAAREAEQQRIDTEEAAARAEHERLTAESDELARQTGELDPEMEAEIALQRHRVAIAQTQATVAAEAPIVVVPVRAPMLERQSGQRFRENWKYEVTDIALIPREFLTVDEKLIGAIVRTKKDATKIPGVKVWCERTGY